MARSTQLNSTPLEQFAVLESLSPSATSIIFNNNNLLNFTTQKVYTKYSPTPTA
jgi:hypothetical protein